MAKPDSQSAIHAAQPEDSQSEIARVVAAAHALHLDAPIIAYRIIGERIEMYTIHGGPFTFDPQKLAARERNPGRRRVQKK